MACRLDHTAFFVRDIGWHIRFFRDVLDMEIRQIAGDPDAPEQVWFVGGIQLCSAPDFDGPEGRQAHLGIATDDLNATLARVRDDAHATALPKGGNWLKLPDGLEIEFIQTKHDAVK